MSDPKKTESHPDMTRPWEEVFFDCFYSIIREAGISLNVKQLEEVQKTCKKSAKRLELKLEQKILLTCDDLQQRVSKGFKLVGKDIEGRKAEAKVLRKQLDDLIPVLERIAEEDNSKT
jgi:hypothetical protein